MSNRIVIGARANGDMGIFVAPPGVDAMTAADSELVLNVSQKVSQLILLGSIAAGGGVVALGLGREPIVLVTSSWDFSGVIGHTLGPGPVRPSPLSGSAASATVNSNGVSMTISAPTKTTYAVYSKALT